ncbi:MAG: glycosyl hydrolase family 28-related protein [Phycisphaerales bacterium]
MPSASQSFAIRFAPRFTSIALAAGSAVAMMPGPAAAVGSSTLAAAASSAAASTVAATASIASSMASSTAGPTSPPVVFPDDARYVHAADFGIVGDGVTDNTAAFNAFFGAPRPAGSSAKPLYLPDGIYVISDTIAFTESRVVLQGQSRDGTIIRLSDASPGFGDPKNPRVVLSTRLADGFSANQFRTGLYNLTISAGEFNPGAIGVKFHCNNQGSMRDVIIRAANSDGFTGLDMTGSDKGPGMIRRVTVDGFDVGIRMAGTEYSMTFEDIDLRNQREAGILNVWNILTIRRLTSDNLVPAIVHRKATPNNFRWGMVTLIDSQLGGGDPSRAAIENEGALFVRNLITDGYAAAVAEDGVFATGPQVPGEYTSDRGHALFGSPGGTLDLPIEDFPELDYEAPTAWASAEDFGADGTDAFGDGDDAPGIQAAIDSGARTVYLPSGRYAFGSPVILRGNVERVVLGESNLEPVAPFDGGGGAMFTLGAGRADTVIVERGTVRSPATGWSFVHPGDAGAAGRTLALRNLTLGRALSAGPGATVHVEDAVGVPWHFASGARAWLRQLNPEGQVTKVINDGADVWILGFKTEGPTRTIVTRGGGRTELLGGLVYPVGTLPLETPMFAVEDAEFSAIIGESSYSGSSNHGIVVQESRGGEVRRLFDDELPTRVGFGRGVQLAYFTTRAADGPQPTGPVARYPLDESAGTTAGDTSGFGRDGSLVGEMQWTTDGRIGGAVQFDGADDHVELPTGFLGSAAGGISLWFRSDQRFTPIGHLVYGTASNDPNANGGGGQLEAHLSLSGAGTPSFFAEAGAGETDLVLDDGNPLADGGWHHLAASWDAGGWSDLYVDGRRVDRARDLPATAFDFTAGLRLGRPNADARRFAGDLDDVVLYDRPLTQAEVIAAWFAGLGAANYPPAVSAGIDQRVQNDAYAAALTGQATDDGQPFGAPSIAWSVVSGPAAVTFADAANPATVATYGAAGTYVLELSIDDGTEARSDRVQIDVYDPLPDPWSNDDEGVVAETGWALIDVDPVNGPGFEVTGSGLRIGGNPQAGGDGFHFVHRELTLSTGVEMIARIDAVDDTGSAARAGLMFRRDLGGSTVSNAFVGLSPTDGVVFTNRAGSGGGTATVATVPDVTAPVWVRLRRESTNIMRAAWSVDGLDWSDLGPATVNVGGGTRIWGPVVTAGSPTELCTATFTGVRVLPPACPGDIDRSGSVDFADLLVALAAWGACPAPCGPDLDASGAVDFGDLLAILSAFGDCSK